MMSRGFYDAMRQIRSLPEQAKYVGSVIRCEDPEARDYDSSTA